MTSSIFCLNSAFPCPPGPSIMCNVAPVLGQKHTVWTLGSKIRHATCGVRPGGRVLGPVTPGRASPKEV